MMDLEITKEEQNVLKKYINEKYDIINQMLVSNSESDIALISDEVENKQVSLLYDKDSVKENLDIIKKIYLLILKQYYKTNPSKRDFYRGTNLAEADRFKSEIYIDRMMSATSRKDDADNCSLNWNKSVRFDLHLAENVPYIVISDLIKRYKNKEEILISPFTKIIKFNDEKDDKNIKVFKIKIEKQVLDSLTENERNGLYSYILDNAYLINRKLDECIKLEKENAINYDNIRKLEQLLSKYESTMDEKELSEEYSDLDREADYNDIKRINKELDELKKMSTEIHEMRKQNINFVNIWKRNIAVYLIAECREIEKEFEKAIIEFEKNTEKETDKKVNSEETSKEEVEEKENTKEEVEEIVEEIVNKSIEEIKENVVEEKVKKDENVLEDSSASSKDDTVIWNVEEKEEQNDELLENVRNLSEENIEEVEKLLSNINTLISKQQNHARIAGNMGATYSALNNGFEMRNNTEKLMPLLNELNMKIVVLASQERTPEIQEKLEKISQVLLEISTLINYLNNPKIAKQNASATRFDELFIIEENELKRRITEEIRSICAEAELKKLKDDMEMIQDKNAFRRIIGLFTGRNKLDDFMIDQIIVRQTAIRRSLSKKLLLSNNYSIHELMAIITMFVDENDDDELVENDVADLKALADELRKNFVIVESKVQSIIEQKEGKNLPLDKRMTKREIIEVETYRFLNKYGYDIPDDGKLEPEYQDTMSHEIGRIVEYINSSGIL